MSASMSTTSETLVVSIETDRGKLQSNPTAGFQVSKGVPFSINIQWQLHVTECFNATMSLYSITEFMLLWRRCRQSSTGAIGTHLNGPLCFLVDRLCEDREHITGCQ